MDLGQKLSALPHSARRVMSGSLSRSLPLLHTLALSRSLDLGQKLGALAHSPRRDFHSLHFKCSVRDFASMSGPSPSEMSLQWRSGRSSLCNGIRLAVRDSFSTPNGSGRSGGGVRDQRRTAARIPRPGYDSFFIVHRQNPLGPVDPSYRALSGRVKFMVRRHKFNKDSSLFFGRQSDRRKQVSSRAVRNGAELLSQVDLHPQPWAVHPG